MTWSADMLGAKLERYETAAIEAVDEAKAAAQAYADAEREYKRAWSQAYARKADAKSHAAKKAAADSDEEVEMLRHAAHLAEALWTAALENSRTRRAVLSSAQSWAAMVRTELELERTGPRMAA